MVSCLKRKVRGFAYNGMAGVGVVLLILLMLTPMLSVVVHHDVVLAQGEGGATIEGTVTDMHEAAVQNAEVEAYGPAPDYDYNSTSTNATGHYSITGLLGGGEYDIYVSAPYGSNLLDNSTTTYLAANQTITVDIVLLEPATIAGWITDINGIGISGATVQLSPGYESNSTDATGYYSIGGLAAGDYTVTVSPPGSYFLGNSTVASVNLGNTTIVNLILSEAGIIAGKVTDKNGIGIQYAPVKASGPGSGDSSTNATGYYSITGLLGGDYTVTVDPPYGSNFIGNSTVATVIPGSTTMVNLILPAAGIIAGTVTYGNGTPISGATVRLTPGYRLGITDGNGTYSIVGLTAGDYSVIVSPPPGANLLSNSTVASVTLGNTTVVNLILGEGGIIAGTITDGNSTPISSATVDLMPGYESGSTDGNGTYSIVGLAAGDYSVTASPPPGANLLSNGTIVSVTPGNTYIVNLMLSEGGIIVGKVTDSNGTGIYNARVEVPGAGSDHAYTNTTGYYSIVGLAAGKHAVTASPPSGANFLSNTTVTMVTLGNTIVVDLVLSPGGIIVGTITYGNGTGIYNARVEVAPSWQTYAYTSTYTNATGYYSVVGLAEGNYIITASPPSGVNLLSNSTVASVTPGGTTVNLVLPVGGISGRVTDSGGNGISDAEVDASGPDYGYDYTNETGYYSIAGLAAGNYTVTAFPPSGANLLSNSTIASVTPGSTTIINLALSMGGITGRVTDNNGSGIDFAEVYASGPDYGYSYTNTTGYYSIAGLTAGNYTVTVSLPYKANLLSNSTVASVTPGSMTIINFILGVGGIISGRVTDNNGSGVYNAWIYASGPSWRSDYTDAAGYYTIAGLAAGSYTVTVSPSYGANLLENSTTANVSLGSTTTVNLVLNKGGVIAGRVTDVDGTGISGVSIDLSGAASGYGYTSAAGYYYIDELVAGNYTVTVSLPSGTDLLSNTTIASVTLGNMTIVNFSLSRGGVIFGRVTYSDQNGISDAEVVATISSQIYGWGDADSAGYYYIFGLPAGDYAVTASPPEGVNLTSNTTTGSVTVCNVTFINLTLLEQPPAPPTVTGGSPNWGYQGETLGVTISGTNFIGVTGVDFGAGITVNNLAVDNTTQMTASISIATTAAAGARNVTVSNPSGNGTLNNGFTVIAVPAPTVTAVSPSSAYQGAILEVTINGTNFISVTGVDFGTGITVNNLAVDSTTQITASISIDGSATAGARDISVTTPGGTATLTSGFTVNQAPPTVTSANPNQGVQGQTLSVTINGTYLTGATVVSFGSGITVSITMNSDTQITANITISDNATVGARDVSVTTPGGMDVLPDGFTVNQAPPAITSVSPNQGIQGQTFNVTITGTHFTGATDVSFGSGITVSFTEDNDTQITASITIDSNATVGFRDVTINATGGTGTKTNGFRVWAPPTVTSVNPDQGIQGQTISVTINGTYLTGATSVSFGSGITVSITMNSDTQITANITISDNATVEARDVLVTTPGGAANLTSGFTVNQAPPAITSVSPNEGIQGQTFNVTITGTHFTGTTDVSFGSGITVNFTEDSDAQITASITIDSNATVGFRDVSVTAAGGTGTKTGGFRVWALPTVTSVNPDQGIQGQTIIVTINGTYLTGATSVSFGSGITVSITMNSDTQIMANITISDNATVGARDVSVTTPGGAANLTSGFTVNQAPPAITSVSPNEGIQGQTFNVTITGTHFTGTTDVSFGSGITVNFTEDSDAQITASIAIDSNATVGFRDVTINATGGAGAKTSGFRVWAPPVVNSVSPDQGIQGQTLSVTINGTYLTEATNVSFGSGVTVNNFNIDSDTQITANITISDNATVEARDVLVTTPGGAANLTSGFTVNQAPPTIISVNPDQGIQGQTFNVTITGTHFTGTTDVSFGSGITVNFTEDSDTQITASITIDGNATVGFRDVTINATGGTGAKTGGFRVWAPPTVTSVNPDQGIQGQTISVTINGTYLTEATNVSFGSGVTVNNFNIDSDTQITANITISDSATVEARDISVTTPWGTGTKAGGFTVNQAPLTITSVTPDQGKQSETISIGINGTYFTGATVSFGSGITLNNVAIDSATHITANITIDGAATLGARNVTVTTPGGTASLIGGFTVMQGAPTITSASPSQGSQGQTLSVSITGAYFTGAAGISLGSGITVTSFTVDNATHIAASLSINSTAALGARNVSVTTSSGTATLTGGFMVVAITANVSVGSDVTVSLGVATVTFGTVTAGGTVTLTRSAESPGGATPADFTVVGFFVDITTTATYSGPVSLAIGYDESGISNENELKLFHWNGASWEDVTTSVDTDNNIIYGKVMTLSPFFVGNPTAPAPTSHLVIYIVIAVVAVLVVGIVAYFALRRRVAS